MSNTPRRFPTRRLTVAAAGITLAVHAVSIGALTAYAPNKFGVIAFLTLLFLAAQYVLLLAAYSITNRALTDTQRALADSENALADSENALTRARHSMDWADRALANAGRVLHRAGLTAAWIAALELDTHKENDK